MVTFAGIQPQTKNLEPSRYFAFHTLTGSTSFETRHNNAEKKFRLCLLRVAANITWMPEAFLAPRTSIEHAFGVAELRLELFHLELPSEKP